MSSHAHESLIYPSCKALVARIAHIALIACWGSASAAVLLLLPLPLGVLALFSELTIIFLLLYSICVGLLLPWCHLVLLPHSGLALTRLLCAVVSFLSLLTLVSYLYNLIMREPLLAQQASTPLLMSFLLQLIIALNFFYTQSLRKLYRLYLLLLPLLYLLCYLAATSRALMIAAILSVLLLIISHPLLRGLQRIAPRIISLPEREDAGQAE